MQKSANRWSAIISTGPRLRFSKMIGFQSSVLQRWLMAATSVSMACSRSAYAAMPLRLGTPTCTNVRLPRRCGFCSQQQPECAKALGYALRVIDPVNTDADRRDVADTLFPGTHCTLDFRGVGGRGMRSEIYTDRCITDHGGVVFAPNRALSRSGLRFKRRFSGFYKVCAMRGKMEREKIVAKHPLDQFLEPGEGPHLLIGRPGICQNCATVSSGFLDFRMWGSRARW